MRNGSAEKIAVRPGLTARRRARLLFVAALWLAPGLLLLAQAVTYTEGTRDVAGPFPFATAYPHKTRVDFVALSDGWYQRRVVGAFPSPETSTMAWTEDGLREQTEDTFLLRAGARYRAVTRWEDYAPGQRTTAPAVVVDYLGADLDGDFIGASYRLPPALVLLLLAIIPIRAERRRLTGGAK
jgi:hypothetical protein